MSTALERRKLLQKQIFNIGKVLLQNPDRLMEAVSMGGCGYLGYKAFGERWEGALAGIVGYKLATTQGGMPPVSQIAGLLVLGTMGLGVAATPFQKIGQDAAETLLNSVGLGTYDEEDQKNIDEHVPVHPLYADPVKGWVCPDDYVLGRHPSIMCWYAPPIAAGEPVDPWVDQQGLIYCPADWGYKYDAATKECVKV